MTTDPLRDRLRAALREAMKARDTVAVAVLRTTLGAIDNAEAVDATTTDVEVDRRHLTESDIESIVRGEVAQLRSAADEYRTLGQPEPADELAAKCDVLDRHLG